MISGAVTTIAKSLMGGSGLIGGTNGDDNNLLVMLVSLVVIIVILLFVGKYAWNEVLVQVLPGVKPLENATQLLLLWVLTSILFGR